MLVNAKPYQRSEDFFSRLFLHSAETFKSEEFFVFLDFGGRSAPIINVKRSSLKMINFGRSEIFGANSFRIWLGDTLHDFKMLCR
jgi:hypothetical protein